MGTTIVETLVSREARWANDAGKSWEQLAEQAHYRPHALARLSGISMRTLQRYFRDRYECTVSSWLRELRLERGRRKLLEEESVKKVAFDLGYKQPSHFTRDFKERFGVPPRSFLRGRPMAVAK